MGEQRKTDTQGRQGQSTSSPLQTERGATTISDAVVKKIAGLAAQEVEKVQVGGGAPPRSAASWAA